MTEPLFLSRAEVQAVPLLCPELFAAPSRGINLLSD